MEPRQVKGFVVPKWPPAVGHDDLQVGKVHGDLFDVKWITVQGLGPGKIGCAGVEHYHLVGDLKEFVERIELAVVRVEVLIGREEFKAADPVSLDVRHHSLGDIGFVRINGAKGNQLRVAFAKIEDEVVGNAPCHLRIVRNTDRVINALALEETDEILRSHKGFHGLSKGGA